MSDGRDTSNTPIRAVVTEADLERALLHIGVPARCNLCNSDNWYYTKNEENSVAWFYSKVESPGPNNYDYGLSYYTRSCLNCGNMQNFARVVIGGALKQLDGGVKSDG